MARKRMIDPNFWGSEDISKLTVFERLMFIGIFSNADDYGKGRATLPYLRSSIFPYDDISIKEIEKALKNIAECTNLILYEIEGNSYFQLTNWKKWQKVDKPTPSKIPDVPPTDSTNDSGNGSASESGSKIDCDAKLDSVNSLEVSPIDGLSNSSNGSTNEPSNDSVPNIIESNISERNKKCEGNSGNENTPTFLPLMYQQTIGQPIPPTFFQKCESYVEDGMEEVVIAQAFIKGKGKDIPHKYIEPILETWFQQKKFTLEDIKEAQVKKVDNKPANMDFDQRQYSEDEYKKFYANLNDE